MTETSTHTGRVTCPDCGRDVAVNKDGSLRKHDCVAAEPAESVQEPMPNPALPVNASAAAVDPAPATAGGRALCSVARCDRVAVIGRLCGAHWATRPDLRKVS